MGHSFPALGFDPAPGDVDLTRGLARQLGHIAAELRTTCTTIDRMECGDWKGKAAVAFADHVAHDVEPLLVKARDSFDKASHAMNSWAAQLADFQHEARALEHEAETKQSALDNAKAAATPQPTPGASPKPTHPSAADQAAAKKAEHAVDEAGSAFNHVVQRAHELQDRYNKAAKAIGGRLDDAGDIAPDRPGFFSRMVHDVEDAWHDCAQWLHDHADMIAHIGDILSAISGVLGVIAIITAPFEPVGAIFAGAAAATSGLALLAHLTAKAEGADVSWTKIGFDALGAVPGIKGFSMGAKVADDSALAVKGADAAETVEGVKATSKTAKTFVLFGKSKRVTALTATKMSGRFKLAGQAARLNLKDGQWVGTRSLNMVTKLPFVKSTQLIDPMSDLGRGVDSGIKSALTGHKIGSIAVHDFGVGHHQTAHAR